MVTIIRYLPIMALLTASFISTPNQYAILLLVISSIASALWLARAKKYINFSFANLLRVWKPSL